MNSEDKIFNLYFLYAPVIIYLVLVVILFVFVIAKYTFGNWTKDNPNPYEKETMGLPRGIFRAVLTLTLLYAAVMFELIHMHIDRPESQMQEFMVAFQMMIAFYFGSKVMHHVASNDRKKTVEKAHQAVEVAKVTSVSSTSGTQSTTTSTTSTTPTTPDGGEFYDPDSEG